MRLPLALVLVALAAACSSQPPSSTPDAGQPNTCVGGVIRDGVCEAKCVPSKCLAGNTCVDNRCQLLCDAHSDCTKYVQECRAAVEDGTGAQVFVCTDTGKVVEYGDPCPFGTGCSDLCYSTGPGDARSYCTLSCLQDTDCPGGYECGWVRDPHQICGTNKGNNNMCGKTSDPCIDRATLVPDGGGELVEGQFCLEKRMCLKKDSCAPCTNSVDCSWAFGQTMDCVLIDEGYRCLPPCTQTSDCEWDKVCASGHCVPKSGVCSGGGFCEICRYDNECPTGMACSDLHGSEKACIDVTFSQTCTTDADCPVAPSGAHGACLDQRHQVDSTSSVYHRCYAPWDAVAGSFTCNPQP